MRSSLVLLILGVVIVAGTFAGNARMHRTQDSRSEDVRLLRLELDSTRAAMAVAADAADSARFTASIAERTRLLSRREGHLGSDSTTDSWWRVSGAGLFAVVVGVLLMALAAFLLRRESSSAG